MFCFEKKKKIVFANKLFIERARLSVKPLYFRTYRTRILPDAISTNEWITIRQFSQTIYNLYIIKYNVGLLAVYYDFVKSKLLKEHDFCVFQSHILRFQLTSCFII